MKAGRVLFVGGLIAVVGVIGYAAYKGSKGQPAKNVSKAGFNFNADNLLGKAAKYIGGFQSGSGFADSTKRVNSSVNDVRADIQAGTQFAQAIGSIIPTIDTGDSGPAIDDGTGLPSYAVISPSYTDTSDQGV